MILWLNIWDYLFVLVSNKTFLITNIPPLTIFAYLYYYLCKKNSSQSYISLLTNKSNYIFSKLQLIWYIISYILSDILYDILYDIRLWSASFQLNFGIFQRFFWKNFCRVSSNGGILKCLQSNYTIPVRNSSSKRHCFDIINMEKLSIRNLHQNFNIFEW